MIDATGTHTHRWKASASLTCKELVSPTYPSVPVTFLYCCAFTVSMVCAQASLAAIVAEAPSVQSTGAGNNVVGGISPGKYGYMMTALKDRPYVLTEITTRTSPDDQASQPVAEERRMRDADGRVRTEVGSARTGSFECSSIYLVDPVSHTTATLFPSSKTAIVHHVPQPDGGAAVDVSPAIPQPTGEVLPPINVSGVRGDGRKTTLVVSAEKSGTGREVTIVQEKWVSPELEVSLKKVTEDPRHGVLITLVTQLRKGEPNPSLFKIPGDYKIKVE